MAPFYQQALDALIPVLAALLTALLANLIRRATQLIEQKTDARTAAALADELNRLAEDAVHFAEEVAHQNKRFFDKNLNADQKKQLAIDTLKKSAANHNLDEERLEQLVLTAVLKFRKQLTGF